MARQNKKNILESWIMVERLSEGNINPRDSKILTLTDAKQEGFYDYFMHLMSEKGVASEKNSGLIVYIDVFSFSEVIQFLRAQYNLPTPTEEPPTGEKFSLALYFNKHLDLDASQTFFTESAYLVKEKRIPNEEEFRDYEERLAKEISEYFSTTSKTEEIAPKFNEAITKVITKLESGIEKCYVQVCKNIMTEGTNLHSFFYKDLELARTTSSPNIDRYLFGIDNQDRINLDSVAQSEDCNPRIFHEILHPNNYPLGRFPSNTHYALSLMQQVAVNLATRDDNDTIRTVNGPPGTGKTTLLKDVFADLIVQQAHHMALLSSPTIQGTEATRYYKNGTIGILPENIAAKNIIVASSNNTAVQNIVNELPLIKDIDENLALELREADYFSSIANSQSRIRWTTNEKGYAQKTVNDFSLQEERYWGLFSLEGGKSDNMAILHHKINEIHKYLCNDYVPQPHIYEEFQKEYTKVEAMRTQATKYVEAYSFLTKIVQKKQELRALEDERERELSALENRHQELLNQVGTEQTAIEQRLYQLAAEKQPHETNFSLFQNQIASLLAQKPSFFAKLFSQEKQHLASRIDQQITYLQNQSLQTTQHLSRLTSEEAQLQARHNALSNTRAHYEQDAHGARERYDKQIAKIMQAIEKYEKKTAILGDMHSTPLDMSMPYEKLQLSNPWFDEKYRIAQSRLFILALRVRKQFLYDNEKNIKAAINIWNYKSKYADRPLLIKYAFDWMNLAIPVISSTFASFSRMCQYLGSQSLGYLFIDEAGQALPQAGVGAIYRSKKVMAVGDPAQITPVLTVDSYVLEMLAKHFTVSKKYLSSSASVQTLGDEASRYGFYKPADGEKEWIGIPLWVHRRCKDPMFNISNRISYNGLMVQGNPGAGRVEWYDVPGKAHDKYVEEQGEFLKQKIEEILKNNPDMNLDEDPIYIISPFRNVAYRLQQKLDSIERFRNAQGRKVGTIHTFQGKEAPIVFMVLGADTSSKGAAHWAVSEPNMMNVAASRAKKEFYVIGDKSLYLSLGSNVANYTYEEIEEYKNNQIF